MSRRERGRSGKDKESKGKGGERKGPIDRRKRCFEVLLRFSWSMKSCSSKDEVVTESYFFFFFAFTAKSGEGKGLFAERTSLSSARLTGVISVFEYINFVFEVTTPKAIAYLVLELRERSAIIG